MDNLYDTLKKAGYKRVKFKISKTQHLLIRAKVNGIEGKFILDTGASNSCVDFQGIAHFNLSANDSDTKAAGAGGIGMLTQTSVKNKLKLGRANGKMFADGEHVYTTTDMKVGLSND